MRRAGAAYSGSHLTMRAGLLNRRRTQWPRASGLRGIHSAGEATDAKNDLVSKSRPVDGVEAFQESLAVHRPRRTRDSKVDPGIKRKGKSLVASFRDALPSARM